MNDLSKKQFFQQTLKLENAKVLLQPLAVEHISALSPIAFEESIWKLGTYNITNETELQQYIADALEQRSRGEAYPFLIFDKQQNRAAGSTRLFNISVFHHRVEIGYTWLGKEFRGTGLNKACKFELLRFCFEELGMERVELKTDARNMQSRKAMLKIGATEEGFLRSHTLNWDGYRRDTIYFSILKGEWEKVKRDVFWEFL